MINVFSQGLDFSCFQFGVEHGMCIRDCIHDNCKNVDDECQKIKMCDFVKVVNTKKVGILKSNLKWKNDQIKTKCENNTEKWYEYYCDEYSNYPFFKMRPKKKIIVYTDVSNGRDVSMFLRMGFSVIGFNIHYENPVFIEARKRKMLVNMKKKITGFVNTKSAITCYKLLVNRPKTELLSIKKSETGRLCVNTFKYLPKKKYPKFIVLHDIYVFNKLHNSFGYKNFKIVKSMQISNCLVVKRTSNNNYIEKNIGGMPDDCKNEVTNDSSWSSYFETLENFNISKYLVYAKL